MLLPEINPGALPSDLSLSGVVSLLRRARRFLAVWVVLWLAVALLVVINLQPFFSAGGMVMLNTRQLHYAEMREVLAGPSTGIDANVVRSEVEILNSPELARRVIEDLNLVSMPEFQPDPPAAVGVLSALGRAANTVGAKNLAGDLEAWAASWTSTPDHQTLLEIAVGRYQKAFSAFNNGRSYVINVGFQASSASVAAAVLNRHMEVYVEDQRRIKNEALTAARAWLDREVSEQAQQLQNAERDLQTYRERFQLYQPRGTSLSAQRLSDMNTQLSNARADLSQREARLERLRQTGSAAIAGDDATDVQASPTISRLREQEAIVRRREAELASQYGPSHPTLRAARAELLAVQRKTQEEVSKVLLGLQSEVQIGQARVAELSHAVAGLEREMGAYERNDAPAREAERQVTITRNLYESLLARQKQVAAQEGIQQADARIVSRATPPLAPSWPRKSLLLAIAGVVATITGVGVVLAREKLRGGFVSPAEVEAAIGLRSLATLPRTGRRRSPGWQVMRQPKSALSEAVRSLRMLLALPGVSGGTALRTIAVTSAMPAEGKTSLSLALARSMAGSGLRVLLVDGDLRRPGIARSAMGREPEHGLVDLLKGTAALEQVLSSDLVAGLEILPAGRHAGPSLAAPQDLLDGPGMAALLCSAAKVYDYVIVDTPPIGLVSDAAIVGRLTQQTILVVEWGKTHRDAVQDGVNTLRMAGVNVAGFVLNGADPRQAPAHSAYHHGLRSAYFHA
jgi:capsular exopolysaccharide synthesis family protein